MSSFKSNEIEFTVDVPTFVIENGGTSVVTIEDIIKNCILPAFKENVSEDCYYFDDVRSSSNTYACIALPYYNDAPDGCFRLSTFDNKTSTIGTSQRNFQFTVGVHGSGSSSPLGGLTTYVMSNSSAATCSGMETPLQYNKILKFKFIRYEECNLLACCMVNYSTSSQPYYLGAPYLLTEMEKNDGTKINAVFTINTTDAIRLSLIENGSDDNFNFYVSGVSASRSGYGVINKFDIGYCKSNLYLANGHYASFTGNWTNAYQIAIYLKDNEKQFNHWYDNAFVIDGQSFDAYYGSFNSYTVILCRKHVEEV